MVEGLYVAGPVSVIAHFKIGNMHVALERSITVLPKTGTGHILRFSYCLFSRKMIQYVL